MVPRTLAINKYMTLLPEVVNLPCAEVQTVSKTGSNRIRIGNKEKLGMEEFFAKK